MLQNTLNAERKGESRSEKYHTQDKSDYKNNGRDGIDWLSEGNKKTMTNSWLGKKRKKFKIKKKLNDPMTQCMCLNLSLCA